MAESTMAVRGIVTRMRRMQESVEARTAEHSAATREILESLAVMRTEGIPRLARQMLLAAEEVEARTVPAPPAPMVSVATPALLPAPGPVAEKARAAAASAPGQ